jgi:hypothetical protein
MSLKGLLVSKLQEAFGTYIDGLDRGNLKMSVMSGTIEQRNLKLKREALDALDLPIAVSAGFLNRFYVKVPWSSLATESVEVEIEGLYLLAAPNRGLNGAGGEGGDAEESAAERARRLSLMQVAVARRLAKLTEHEALRQAMADEGDSTFAQRMGKRILANLQVTIKNVHVRFEDAFAHAADPGTGRTAVCYRTPPAVAEAKTKEAQALPTALPTFLQDVDRAQIDEMIRLLTQATAHYGGATAEAVADVGSKLKITVEQVQEVIRWIQTEPVKTGTSVQEPGACITVAVTEFAQLIKQSAVPPETLVRVVQRLLPWCSVLANSEHHHAQSR